MFGFLFSWLIGQRGPKISCTKTQKLPNLRLPISSAHDVPFYLGCALLHSQRHTTASGGTLWGRCCSQWRKCCPDCCRSSPPGWSRWSRCTFSPCWDLQAAMICFEVVLHQYRVIHLVVDLGLVDFDLSVPPSCPTAQPLLPNSHQPRQNWADSGTLKTKVKPTKSASRLITQYAHFIPAIWCGSPPPQQSGCTESRRIEPRRTWQIQPQVERASAIPGNLSCCCRSVNLCTIWGVPSFVMFPFFSFGNSGYQLGWIWSLARSLAFEAFILQ